ncbi:uncharacterized protein LOC110453307 [Mizuhopecten yessoensis]|uniref:uncharacterized protein LOC110453307 n=1 Tax=Mizuhopecten yessoensis TaxID=6573 RepID=UPI000B458A46|nr:uncharacterized protein LOC110453307 [Mizuhopecten yessoensis]
MSVDLAVYRSRVGQFVPRPVKGIVSNIDYLCKAIASVRGGLIRQDGLNSKGAVTFIDLLLRAHGIEPNPGPGKRGQRSVPDEPEENDDVSIHLDSNVTLNSADRISRVMDFFSTCQQSFRYRKYSHRRVRRRSSNTWTFFRSNCQNNHCTSR